VPIFFVGLYSPAICALLVGLFYLFERALEASVRSAALAAALLCATTYVATMSTFFLQHPTEALLLLTGFFGLRAFRGGASYRVLAAASLAASLVLLVRIPGLMAAPALAGYALWVVRERCGKDARAAARALACLALPALAVLAVHVAVNWWRFGTWMRSPYLDQMRAFTGSIWLGVQGFLFSPGGSIFLYSPLLLLLPFLLAPFWRRQRAECATLLVLAVTYVVACSKNEDWTGLYSAPGPRFLFTLTPFLLLPLGPWLGAPGRRVRAIALAALAVAGWGVQLVSMSAHWGNTIEIMRWREFVPALSFVWAPAWCPLAGGVHAIAQGSIDPFPWKLFFGAPGIEAAPVAAVILVALWAASLAWMLRKLVRAVAAAPS
jgi:hypothetical protein